MGLKEQTVWGAKKIFEEISIEIGGTLTKEKDGLYFKWKLTGTQNKIPYDVDFFVPGPQHLFLQYITLRISSPLEKSLDFKIFGSFGVTDILRKRKPLAQKIGVSGRDIEYGKKFLERNKKEIVELSKTNLNPIDVLIVKNGIMSITTNPGSKNDYKKIPLIIDLLTTIAKRESV
ncbi:MAG: hypothetical protein ABIG39_00670 [Candidatus Micrarchaeota archaeon]